MLRAALFMLLVACVLNGPLQAQRAALTSHGNAAGRPAHSGFVEQRNSANRFFPRQGSLSRHFHRRDSFGSILVPYDEPFGYEQPDVETVTSGLVAPVVPQPIPEPPIPRAILANGERLETRRFVLTASLLSVSIDRHQRTVPLDLLDISATITSNHERGIELRIPDDRNEITLSF